MKYLLLLAVLFLHTDLFSQEIISDSVYIDSYVYTGFQPLNPIKINDSTLCFTLFTDYTYLGSLKIICCDKNLSPKWIFYDSCGYVFSQDFSYTDGVYDFYSFYGNTATIFSSFYRHIRLSDNGGVVSKNTSPIDYINYGFSGSPVIKKINKGCIVLQTDYRFSEMIFFDTLDNLVWRKKIDTIPNNNLKPYITPLVSENNLICIGPAKIDTIGTLCKNLFFLKSTFDGNISIKKFYGNFNFDNYSIGACKKINENLFVFLYHEKDTTVSIKNPRVNPRLIFFNKEGDSLYTSYFGEDSGMTLMKNVSLTSDGNLITYGFYAPDVHKASLKQFYVAKFDTNGTMLWKKIWGYENSNDEIFSFVEMDKNEYIFLGSSYGEYISQHLYKAVIYDGPNSVKETIAQESELKISPNPAGNTLKIENAGDFDKIEIFDIRGELVATFSSSQDLDISRLSSGAYNIKAYA